MNIYITLDYELFFGDNSGSAEACIIRPMQALLDIVDPLGIKLTCFVDVGYLVRLEHQKSQFPALEEDYKRVSAQIRYLADNNHGIELHIHPHWEDSYFDGTKWVFDTSRYKLADFSEAAILDIVTRYTKTLTRISGKTPVAFRAGGWSAQPFAPIQKALAANNIYIDSTVFPGGKYSSSQQTYNFKNVPQYKTEYQFSTDLTVEDTKGAFTEIPISSIAVSPSFFWKFAYRKLKKNAEDIAFGDGSAISLSQEQKIKLMTTPSHTVVSIDGYKASLLEKALSTYKTKTKNEGNLVLIGHPKAFTPYSLNKVSSFIKKHGAHHSFVTFNN